MFAVAGAGLAVWWWPHLPAQMPSHWGADGQADAFMSREAVVAVAPLLSLMVPLSVLALTRIDPRRAHVERSQGAFGRILVALSAFFFGLQILMLQASMRAGHGLDTRGLLVGLGLLLMVVGNALPKFQSNWFAGIRTPWTLESEAVWHRTHRVGGWTFVCAGVVTAVAPFVASTEVALAGCVAGTLVASLVPVFYSWSIRKDAEPG